MSMIRRTNPLGERLSVRAALNRLFGVKPRQVKIKARSTGPRTPKSAAIEGRDR